MDNKLFSKILAYFFLFYGSLGYCELEVGRCYYLQAENGRFLTIGHSNEYTFSPVVEEKTLFCIGNTPDAKVTFKSIWGTYISARVDRASFGRSGQATFSYQQAGDTFLLRTIYGTYLGVDLESGSLVQLAEPPLVGQRLIFVAAEPHQNQLFETVRSPEELTALKTQFLEHTPVLQSVPGRPYFDVNSVRGPSLQPKSPIVHSYHIVGVAAPLVVKLPDEFKMNIPELIRNRLSKLDVNQMDIYFTPQLEVRSPDASLKPAYWMFPDRPELALIHGCPIEYYKKKVWMALFDSNSNIERGVRTNLFSRFSATLHDGRVSPNTGHLNMTAVPEGRSFAFYSVTVYEEQKRAAVTLHWLLTSEDRDQLEYLLSALVAHGESNNFGALLNSMDAEWTSFHNTSLMQKLRALTAP